MEQEGKVINPEWVDQTKKYKDSIAKFLKNWYASLSGKGMQYDSITELHFSGSNSDVNDKIKQGTAKIIFIMSFDKQGKPEQIHVTFDGENKGQNIDVYLKGQALADFLKFKAKSEEK